MATLINQIQIVNLAPATPTAFAHGLNIDGVGLVPDRVEADNAELQINSADATNVVVENIGAAPVSGTVQASHLHSLGRVIPPGLVNLPVQPFIPQSGGGGGVGTAGALATTGADVDVASAAPPSAGLVLKATDATHAQWLPDSGVSNPLVLATGNGTVTAPAGYASGAIGHGIDGDVGTADVQVDPLASGLALGWTDSYTGGTAQVKNASKGGFAHGYAKADGAFSAVIETTTGNEGAQAFGFARAWNANAAIRSADHGALAFGWAGGFNYTGYIQSDGWGALAAGYVFGYGGAGQIRAASDGAIAFGGVYGGGSIYSSRHSIAQGYAKNGGVIDAHARGASVFGYALGSGSTIAATDVGGHAHGYATSGGRIEANGYGGTAVGYAQTSGNIYGGRRGAWAGGYAHGGADIVADLTGFAFGRAYGAGSIMEADYQGSMVIGQAVYGGQMRVFDPCVFLFGYSSYNGASITGNARGAMSHGHAYDSGRINADGRGSMASGSSRGFFGIGDSYLSCHADGGHVFGAAQDGGLIQTTSGGKGNMAGGYAVDAARIYARHFATIAWGVSDGEDAEINGYGKGSFALGHALAPSGGAKIGTGTFSGVADGAFAHGFAWNASGGGTDPEINASEDGAQAHGYSKDGAKIFASGKGSHAAGYANGLNSHIYGSAAGAFAHGYTKVGRVIADATGATAFGHAEAASSFITAHAKGCFAVGIARYGGSYIRAGTAAAAGYGSFAGGWANGYNIRAEGDGNFAFGAAGMIGIDIIANGSTNCFQFGEGTNSQLDSLQVGNGGIRFRGTVQAGVPAGVQNGDFWVDAGGDVWVYGATGGAVQLT